MIMRMSCERRTICNRCLCVTLFFYEYPPLALPSAKVSFIVGRLDDVGATSIDVGSVVCRTSMCSALFVLLGLKRLFAPLAPAQCVGASQAGLPVCLSVCMELM